MKKNAFIVFSLIAVLGSVIFWSQQYPAQSTVPDLDKVISDTTDNQTQPASSLSNKVISDAIDKQTQPASSLSNKVEVELETASEADVLETAINDDRDSNEKEPATLEEAVAKARLAHFKSSGLLEKHQQAVRKLERHNQQLQAYKANRMGHNERAKKLLNIDVVKNFNVDLDAEMNAVQARGQREHQAMVDKQLAAMGVAPEQRKQLAIMRAQLLGTATIIDE